MNGADQFHVGVVVDDLDAAQMLADEPDIARTVITHRYPIEDAGEAFRVAGERQSGAIRVVVEPS